MTMQNSVKMQREEQHTRAQRHAQENVQSHAHAHAHIPDGSVSHPAEHPPDLDTFLGETAQWNQWRPRQVQGHGPEPSCSNQ